MHNPDGTDDDDDDVEYVDEFYFVSGTEPHSAGKADTATAPAPQSKRYKVTAAAPAQTPSAPPTSSIPIPTLAHFAGHTRARTPAHTPAHTNPPPSKRRKAAAVPTPAAAHAPAPTPTAATTTTTAAATTTTTAAAKSIPVTVDQLQTYFQQFTQKLLPHVTRAMDVRDSAAAATARAAAVEEKRARVLWEAKVQRRMDEKIAANTESTRAGNRAAIDKWILEAAQANFRALTDQVTNTLEEDLTRHQETIQADSAKMHKTFQADIVHALRPPLEDIRDAINACQQKSVQAIVDLQRKSVQDILDAHHKALETVWITQNECMQELRDSQRKKHTCGSSTLSRR